MKGQPASQQSNKNMTDRPTQHPDPEALRDGSRPTVRLGHPETAHSMFGSLPVNTSSCNHSAIGHDPVSLSALDPPNKGFP
ncbi:hypothetical protein Bca4012_083449 [Brassica carinata]